MHLCILHTSESYVPLYPIRTSILRTSAFINRRCGRDWQGGLTAGGGVRDERRHKHDRRAAHHQRQDPR